MKTEFFNSLPITRPASLRGPVAAVGYGWRWLGTALSFVLFGAGSILLGIVVVPLVSLASRDPAQRLQRVRGIIGGALRFFIVVTRHAGLMSYEVEGLENMVAGRSYLIVANHPTLIDAVFLLAFFPMADCVIKEGMARNFFTRHLVRAANYIPNADPVALLDAAVARLKSGRSLILFPEGTRTVPGAPLCFKPGAAAVAVRSGRECLPVVIRCEPMTLSKSDRWYRIPPRRAGFSISVQPPVAPAQVIGAEPVSRYANRSFNAWLQAYFSARLAGPG
ncbi:MAG: 1-acyl-sn-glycerol-3-phosphate acyltransferase [Gammaproteobacteria bacterium]|nr:1-acyl-sn-glycerol-3-phosphate acyltransferase [Gammaproteobacteria bacterium]